MRVELLSILCWLAFSCPALAQGDGGKAGRTTDVKELARRMQAFYEKTSSFTANFKQEYTYQAFHRTQNSSGRVSFLKPAMMRWDYEKPSPKTFVLTGDKMYAYDAEAATFTIASFDSNQLSAAVTFLWGKGRLEKEFRIQGAPCANCNGVLLELNPLRPDPRFQKIQLEVDPKTAQVLTSSVVDPDGSENRISFSDFKANEKIDKGRFHLTPPPNAQVVDMTKKSP
jgi:outer membrane lipoprotein carrier protein